VKWVENHGAYRHDDVWVSLTLCADTQAGQTLASVVNPQFKPLAYALILLRHEGYPCVFSGDLWGIDGDAGENEKAEPITQLGDIIAARRWFAYGETRDYWDHPNCLGWVRAGDALHDGLAVVLCTGDEASKRMEVGQEHAGEEWTDLLGWHQATVTIGEDGWAEFFCPAASVSIWTRKNAKGRANNFPVQYSTTEST
jgi:alpha-amylase